MQMNIIMKRIVFVLRGCDMNQSNPDSRIELTRTRLVLKGQLLSNRHCDERKTRTHVRHAFNASRQISSTATNDAIVTRPSCVISTRAIGRTVTIAGSRSETPDHAFDFHMGQFRDLGHACWDGGLIIAE